MVAPVTITPLTVMLVAVNLHFIHPYKMPLSLITSWALDLVLSWRYS